MCHMNDKEGPGRELVGKGLLKANSQSLWHYHHGPKCLVANLELVSVEWSPYTWHSH